VTVLLRVGFWLALICALIMALLPQPPLVPGAPSDKVQHILAFATLAALGSFAYRSTSPVALLAGLSAWGALMELLQAIPALNRDSDPLDWIADTAAAAAVLVAIYWWRLNRDAGGG